MKKNPFHKYRDQCNSSEVQKATRLVMERHEINTMEFLTIQFSACSPVDNSALT